MALLLNRPDVQKLLPMSQAIDVVEAAFGELEAGTAEMPARTVFMIPAPRSHPPNPLERPALRMGRLAELRLR